MAIVSSFLATSWYFSWLNLPFGEDKIEALPAAAHMPYVKQSFYKELIHHISKTIHAKKPSPLWS
jgi:hypothetical protein